MSQELTDTALLKSWTRRRDADAFCALTNRYGRVVFAASLRVLGNTTDAEDVTQECFEKLAATSRAPGDYLGAWLHRIATNRALDMLRAQTRRTARETSYAEDLSTQSDPDWQEIYPRVDEAVNALPDKYRRAIVAHYLCGKTHEAIAAQEGVTRSAVTRRLKRGLELLKAHLSKQGVTLSASVFAAFYGSDVLRAAEIPVKLASDLGRIALSGAAMPVVPAFAWSLLVKGAVSLAGIILVMMGALTTYRALNPDPISDESQLPLTLTAATDEIQTNAQPEEVLQPPSQIIVASNLELATRAETLTASVQSEPNVSGHVTDAVTGQGISGALIKAYTQSGRQEVRTDQDGYFEFRDLPEGQCGIGCREANGYLVTNPFHDTGDGGFTSVAPHKILEVEADQQRIADFQLSRGQSLQGRVVDQAGRGLNDMRISPQFEKSASIRTISTNSDESGNFELRGLFPGMHIMRVVAKEGTIAYSPAPRVTVAAGEVLEGLEFLCNVGNYLIAGRVVDRRGEAVANAAVELRGAGSTGYSQSLPDGTFEFSNILYDTYRVSAVTNDHLPADVWNVEAGTRGVTVTLQEAFQVGGVVVDDETGEPISDYEIKDCNAPRFMILDQRYTRQQTKDGAFSVRVNQIRTIRIAARAEGYLLGYVDVELDETRPDVPPQTIRLKRQPALHGNVHTQDGESVDGALIFSGGDTGGNEPDNYASTRTQADGSFILQATKLGHDFITILHRAYPTTRLILEEHHYAGTPMDVTLFSGTETLTTVTLNGEPLADVHVEPFNIGRGARIITGEDGQALLNSLEPGIYTIQANAPWETLSTGRTLLSSEVEIVGGKRTDLDLDFVSGTASLSGVLQGRGKNVHMSLLFFEDDNPQIHSTLLDWEVRSEPYSFSNLPAMPARLEVTRDNKVNGKFIKNNYELDFSAGGEITFDINLHGDVTLEAQAPPLNRGEQVRLTVKHGIDPDVWIPYCTMSALQTDALIIIPELDAGSYSLVLSRYRENAAGETFRDAEQVLLVELTQPNETVVFPDW